MKTIFILSWDLKVTAVVPGLYDEKKKKSLFYNNNFLRKALPFEEISSLAGYSRVNLGNRGKRKAKCTKAKFKFQIDLAHTLINPGFGIIICFQPSVLQTELLQA